MRPLQYSIIAALFYAYWDFSPISVFILLYFFAYWHKNFGLWSDYPPKLDELYHATSSSYPTNFAYSYQSPEDVLPSSYSPSPSIHPSLAPSPGRHYSFVYCAPFWFLCWRNAAPLGSSLSSLDAWTTESINGYPMLLFLDFGLHILELLQFHPTVLSLPKEMLLA